jgi:hypothetical protein
LDEQITDEVELHCIGGFVVTQHYCVAPRETIDIDFLIESTAVPVRRLDEMAGLHSRLHRKHGVYLEHVTVVTPPCEYRTRLQPMFPDSLLKKLRLFALDPIDLALSKLERNADRDREDYLRLYRGGLIDLVMMRERYFTEMRPYLLSREEWCDHGLSLWVAMADDL